MLIIVLNVLNAIPNNVEPAKQSHIILDLIVKDIKNIKVLRFVDIVIELSINLIIKKNGLMISAMTKNVLNECKMLVQK